MRIVSFATADRGVRYGIVDGGDILDAGASLADLRRGDPVGRLGSVALGPPVPNPGKVIAIGLNYREHALEGGETVPASPMIFAKFSTAIIGPDSVIRIPSITTQVDFEAELAVVIGRMGRQIRQESALDYVLGYTCLNDVSARDLQVRDGQFTRAKSLDTFCPIGPWIVTADEISDPQSLGIRSVLNGVRQQDANTSAMIFGVAELIAFVSEAITLCPGDIITTGTPSGVGAMRNPPIFMKDGDMIEIEIDGIGSLRNRVEQA